MQKIRPTIFLGVPRVWEKFEETIRKVDAGNTGLTRSLGDWAKRVGLEGVCRDYDIFGVFQR